MNRNVTAALDIDVAGPARLAVQIGVASPDEYSIDETIEISLNGSTIPWRLVNAPHGGRVWLIDSAPGTLTVHYHAALAGCAPPPPVTDADELLYLRPSRYCESDRLIGFASRTFRDITLPRDLLTAVSSWVGTELTYVSGSSDSTDGAINTLVAARGVCRDYAHLTVAMLRALEVPARFVAVYAPGLDPMDFHAVVEALIDGAWYVADATVLAPRRSLVRIATGRDAADTSFVTSFGGPISLNQITVTATVGGDLPAEDVSVLSQIS